MFGDEIPSGVVSKRKAHDLGCTVSCFSAAGGVAATGGGDGYVKVWDIARGADVKKIKLYNSKSISSIGYSITGDFIATAGNDLSINLIKVKGSAL